MKNITIPLVAVFVLIFTVLFSPAVCAESYEYNISTDKSFTTVRSGDDLTDIAEKLNMTTDELNGYFNKNGLLYLSVSEDAKTQIRLSAFSDNFSSVAEDISHLSDSQLKEFLNAVSNDGENDCEIVENGGRKFIKTKDTLVDSGGTYTVTQYITICNNKTFYLSCYNEGDDTSAQTEEIFKNFSLNTVSDEPADNKLYVFIIAGIVVFSLLSLIMIIGLIKNLPHRKA